MVFPTTTATWAALFGLYYVGLSVWVIAGRGATKVLQGDGGNADMQRRIRSHANFGEYVPLALLILAFYEASGGRHGLVATLLVVLLVARVAHPLGMFAAPNSPRQFACRGGGAIGTLLVLGVAAVALLIRML